MTGSPSVRYVIAQEAEDVDEAHDGRTDRHDEEGGKQAEHEREDQLRADPGSKLFRSLHALVPEFLGVDPQRFADARAELERLDQEAHEPADVLQAGARGERLERRFTLDAGTHLGRHPGELRAEIRVAELQLVRDPLERVGELESRLYADDEKVERVRESVTQASPPRL